MPVTPTPTLKIVKTDESAFSKMPTINEAFNDIDQVLGAILVKNLTGNVTLTRAEALNARYKFTGTGTFTVSIDPIAGMPGSFFVWNATTGYLTVKLTTGGSVGRDVGIGAGVRLFHDGTNVYYEGAEIIP